MTVHRDDRPTLHIDLSGPSGNAFAVVGLAERALKQAGRLDEAKKLVDVAYKSGSYEELLRTVARYVDVDDVSGLYEVSAEAVRVDGEGDEEDNE